MNKKMFFLFITFCCIKINVQCMNMISSLHNLEIKLTQLKQFLIHKESENISHLLAEFKSSLQAMQAEANIIRIGIKDISEMQLFVMHVDSSGNPMNRTAHQVSIQAASVRDSCKMWFNIFTQVKDALAKIGDYFKKEKFTHQEKQLLISLLSFLEEQINVLQEIKNMLQYEDLKYIARLNFPGVQYGFGEPNIIDFLKLFLSNQLYVVSTEINIIGPRIKELIENNSESIRNDIKIIKNNQQKIQENSDQGLELLEQIKKIEIKRGGSDQETNISNALKNILQQPVYDLTALLKAIQTYGAFIKDMDLKKELLITIRNQDYQKLIESWREKISELDELDELKNKRIPMIAFTTGYRINEIFENLKNDAQEVENSLGKN